MKRPSKSSGRSGRSSERGKPAKGRSRGTTSRGSRYDDRGKPDENPDRKPFSGNSAESGRGRGRSSEGDRRTPRSKSEGNRTQERPSSGGSRSGSRFERAPGRPDSADRSSDSRKRYTGDDQSPEKKGRNRYIREGDRQDKRPGTSNSDRRTPFGQDKNKRGYDSDSRQRYDRTGEGKDKPKRTYNTDSPKRDGEEYSRPKRNYGTDDRRRGPSDDFKPDRRRDFSEGNDRKPARDSRGRFEKRDINPDNRRNESYSGRERKSDDRNTGSDGRNDNRDFKPATRRTTRDEPWSGSERKNEDRNSSRSNNDRPDSKPERRGSRPSEDERPGRSWNESKGRGSDYNRPASKTPWDSLDKGGRNPSGYKPSRYSEGPPRRPRVRYEDGELPPLQKEIRLNRYISMAGICSRREADELIEAGVISVNGTVVTELGMKVKPGDDVRYNGERIKNEKPVYILLNKPKDYITTADDPEGRKTVMELISGACDERVYPVGRLDRNTTGLLLFTNDGDLAKFLTHPSSRVKKIYAAELDRNFKVSDMQKVREGLVLEDGKAEVDDIDYDEDGSDKKKVGIEIHSGKNRIVRRIFEHLGYEVKKLDRVIFAGLTKKDLPRGRWRILNETEVNFLKVNTGAGKKKIKKPTKQEQDR